MPASFLLVCDICIHTVWKYTKRLVWTPSGGDHTSLLVCRQFYMVSLAAGTSLSTRLLDTDQLLGVTMTFTAPEVTTEVKRLLQHLTGEMDRQALQDAMGLRNAEHFRKSYINPALELEVIEMTIPDKPRSSNQQYRISQIGKQILKKYRNLEEDPEK